MRSGERVLEPLPELPRIAVDPEALPGEDGSLAVVIARPTGATSGAVRPTVTFSKPVAALDAVETGAALAATIEPKVAGSWRWLDSASAAFVPDAPLPYATAFRVTVPAGVVALDGSRLPAAHVWEFETPRPELQRDEYSPEFAWLQTPPRIHAAPAPGFPWLAPVTRIELIYNQAVMDLATRARFLVEGAAPIGVRVVEESALADLAREEEPARRYPRAEPGLLGFRTRQTRYLIEPAAPLPPGAEVTLEIDSALASREGPLLGGGERLTYRTYGPMRFIEARACTWGDCPEGPIVLLASNAMEIASLKTRLRIDPPVDVDWDAATTEDYPSSKSSSVHLAGAYRPGTTYRVTVDAGVLDVFGQSAPAFEATVRIDDRDAALRMGSGLALLEASGDGSLSFETVNSRRNDARIWHLTPAEMAKLLSGCRYGPGSGLCRPAGAPVERTIDVPGTRNVPLTVPLPLREMLGRNTGLFFAEVGLPKRLKQVYPPQSIAGQITDLAVHTKLGAASGIVWVTSLDSGKPVERASVSLYDRTGTRRWRGTTDGDGLVRVPGLSPLLGDEANPSGPPFALVAAEKGGDVGVTLSSWQGNLWAGAFGFPSDRDGAKPVPVGTVFAERGIYRPGDEVFVKGLVRYRRLGELATPPAGTRVTVEVHTSTGGEVFSKNVPLTAFGTFSTKVPLATDAPLGRYGIRVKAVVEGGEVKLDGEFRVAEYRAPHFRVDVASPAGSALSGEPFAATVLARYLHGGGIADTVVRWSITRETISFRPPGHPGFSFGRQAWWTDKEVPPIGVQVFASGETPTDTAGAAVITAGNVDTPAHRTFAYTVEAEVADVNRQRVANRATVTVHPASFYVGVKVASDGFATAGRPVPIEVIAVDPAGIRGEEAVAVEVRRLEWTSTRERRGRYWHTAEKPVETRVAGCDLRTGANAVTCTVTPEKPGEYVVEATGVDDAGRKAITRTTFYVAGPGRVSWKNANSNRLDLVADRQRYDVGDTAKILLKSPFPEAEAVITVEREGVRSARRFKLDGTASTVEVPIDEWMIPNAFVSVVAVRGRVPAEQAESLESGGAPGTSEDLGRPTVRVGYTELSVERRAKRLAVTVTPDAAEKRPGDRLAIDVQVVDAEGKGRRAEVTLWAVDEGVLRLTGHEVPDPVESIHPHRGLSVRVGEPLLFLAERRRYGDKEWSPGGWGYRDPSRGDTEQWGRPKRYGRPLGALYKEAATSEPPIDEASSEDPSSLPGRDDFDVSALLLDDAAAFRSRFQTTSLFEPNLVTDTAGHARVEVALPDNLTTYRILAVAVSKGDEAGAGSSQVTVRKPLLALPALPRAARVGDSFEAGVVVHAAELQGAGRVAVAAEGISIDGPTEKAVSLGTGPEEVRFRFRADHEGTTRIRFAVAGAGERDGVEATVPVHLPVAMEAVATYGDTRDLRVEAVVPPHGVRPGVGGLELTLASTALAGLDEGMRQLVTYPHGCLESLSSRLVPFVALRELSDQFGMRWGAKERRELFRSLIGEEALSRFDTSDPDAAVKATVAEIQALQNDDGGFGYWPSDRCSSSYASAYAVLALGRAREVGYPADAKVLARGQAYLVETVAGKAEVCWWDKSALWEPTRVWALWALARTGAPQPSYYAELADRHEQLPLFARALLADAMFIGGGDRAEARKILAELLNHARESASGVHFEEVDARAFPALWSSDTRTTAIVLLALTHVSPDHPYGAKLARWLAGARRIGGGFGNTQEAAFSLMALAEVVRTKERETPSFTAGVTLGDRVVVKRAFEGRSLQALKTTVPIDALGGGKRDLSFAMDGKGVLYYGALLRYAPAEMPVTPLDRGIVVQRWFEPYEGGGHTRSFVAGELVRVRLRVGSSQERQFVAVEAPLPAGLEAVDTTLASTASLPRTPEEEGPRSHYEYESAEDTFDPAGKESLPDWARWFYSPFNHVERRDDRVVLFANRLPPGIHVVSFVARATTPGDFLLPPATAHEMYAPETFGRSDGGRLQVTAAAPLAEP